jgi:hypothetical protein
MLPLSYLVLTSTSYLVLTSGGIGRSLIDRGRSFSTSNHLFRPPIFLLGLSLRRSAFLCKDLLLPSDIGLGVFGLKDPCPWASPLGDVGWLSEGFCPWSSDVGCGGCTEYADFLEDFSDVGFLSSSLVFWIFFDVMVSLLTFSVVAEVSEYPHPLGSKISSGYSARWR